MSKKRCSYCGKIIENNKLYCDENCRNKYEEFEKSSSNNISKCMGIAVISLIIGFIGMLLTAYDETLGNTVSTASALMLFLTFLIFPFATSSTIEFIGVKKSKLIVRLVAGIAACGTLGSIIFGSVV